MLAAVEKELKALEEADDREHGDAAVGHLSLAVALHLLERAVRGEAKRVEAIADRREGAREAPRERALVRGPAIEAGRSGSARFDRGLRWSCGSE